MIIGIYDDYVQPVLRWLGIETENDGETPPPEPQKTGSGTSDASQFEAQPTDGTEHVIANGSGPYRNPAVFSRAGAIAAMARETVPTPYERLSAAALRNMASDIDLESLRTVSEIGVEYLATAKRASSIIDRVLRHNIVAITPMPDHLRDSASVVNDCLTYWDHASEEKLVAAERLLTDRSLTYPPDVSSQNLQTALHDVRRLREDPKVIEFGRLSRELGRIRTDLMNLRALHVEAADRGHNLSELEQLISEKALRYNEVFEQRRVVFEGALFNIRFHPDDLREIRPATHLIGEVADAELPQIEDLNIGRLEIQIRALLPRTMRNQHRYIHQSAGEVMATLRALPSNHLRRLYREELERHGSIIRGAAPEAVVLEQLERVPTAASQDFAGVRITIIRDEVERRLERGRPQILESILEGLRRAGEISRRR